jgi:hypothetical protein
LTYLGGLLLNSEAIAFAICFFIGCCVSIYFLFIGDKKKILLNHKKLSKKMSCTTFTLAKQVNKIRDDRYECICEVSLKGKKILGQVERDYLSKINTIGDKKIFTFLLFPDDKKIYKNKDISIFLSIILANKTGCISKEEFNGLQSKAIEFPSKEKKIKLRSYSFYKSRALRNFKFVSNFDCLLTLFLRSEKHYELEKLRENMGRLGFIESIPAKFCLMNKGSLPYCVAQFGASKDVFNFSLNIALVENPHLKFKEFFDGLRWLAELGQLKITNRYGSSISEPIADKILGEIKKKEIILEDMGLKAGSRLCQEIFR